MADLLIRKLENISYKTYEMLQQLAPFGASNPEPVFLIEGMRIQSSWVGGANGRNLRLNLKARNFHFSATLIRGGARQAFLPQRSACQRHLHPRTRLEPYRRGKQAKHLVEDFASRNCVEHEY